jgi:hypothetical protein
MFTMVAWQDNVAGTAAYKQMAAVPDQHVRVAGNLIYVPDLNQLIKGYICGGTIGVGAYFDSPSIRRQNLVDIAPIVAAVNPADANGFEPNVDNPVALIAREGLAVQRIESTTTTEIRTAFALLADGPLTQIDGPIWTVRATATITSVTSAWVNGSLTLSQALPVGTYQLVGARCFTATGVCFRFVFPGGTWRPGGLCATAIGARDPLGQRYGGWGAWGTFTELTPPTIELLAGTAAAQSPVVYMDIIKVA